VIDPAPSDLDPAYGPMTRLEDLLVHSAPRPVGRMWSNDPHVFEQMWFSGHSAAADLLIVAGIGHNISLLE
jgi:hypothetical protein